MAAVDNQTGQPAGPTWKLELAKMSDDELSAVLSVMASPGGQKFRGMLEDRVQALFESMLLDSNERTIGKALGLRTVIAMLDNAVSVAEDRLRKQMQAVQSPTGSAAPATMIGPDEFPF